MRQSLCVELKLSYFDNAEILWVAQGRMGRRFTLRLQYITPKTTQIGFGSIAALPSECPRSSCL